METKELLIEEAEKQIAAAQWSIDYHKGKLADEIVKLNLAEYALNQLRK